MRRPAPRERSLLALVVLAIALCVPLLAYGRYADASARLDAAHRTRASLAGDVRKLGGLLATDAAAERRSGDQRRAERDLLTRLQATLLEAGAERGSITDLRIDEPRPIDGGLLERQSASVTLGAASPPEIARFLAEWSNRNPLWRIATLNLDHERQTDSDRYRATVRFENIFLRETAAPAERSTTP